MKIRSLSAAALMLAMLCSCSAANNAATNVPEQTIAVETPTPVPTEKPSAAKQTLAGMTLNEKVWQMFFVTPEDIIAVDTVTSAGEMTGQALAQYPVGGILYFGKNLKTEDQVKSMISGAQSFSRIPMLISVDEEGGRVSRLGGANIIAKQPPMGDIGAMGEAGVAEAARVGGYLGSELYKLGFNMDFAPVADVITVENNTDIGNRSFGKDPQLVARMVSAEVEAMQAQNVSATLKHFPSNGSTVTNTHYESGVCTRTLDEMRACEFIPFKAGIDAGADAVMVAHMAAVNVIGENVPSTLSPVIINEYLRGELGFKNLVISDALNMGAITNAYSPTEAAVLAVKAGVDMLLMSPDPKAAAQVIIENVKNGSIPESRIDESVMRILELKEKKGLIQASADQS